MVGVTDPDLLDDELEGPNNATGLLIIRASVEPGSSDRLRAHIRLTRDVSCGIESTLTLSRVDQVCSAVGEWLAEIFRDTEGPRLRQECRRPDRFDQGGILLRDADRQPTSRPACRCDRLGGALPSVPGWGDRAGSDNWASERMTVGQRRCNGAPAPQPEAPVVPAVDPDVAGRRRAETLGLLSEIAADASEADALGRDDFGT